MKHWLVDEWALGNQNLLIDCSKVYGYIKYKKYQFEYIDIDLIAFKPLIRNFRSELKIKIANLDLPCIVVKDMKNPLDKPFRMIDGRHRISKCIDMKIQKIKAYVIDEKKVMKFAECGNSFGYIHSNYK